MCCNTEAEAVELRINLLLHSVAVHLNLNLNDHVEVPRSLALYDVAESDTDLLLYLQY